MAALALLPEAVEAVEAGAAVLPEVEEGLAAIGSDIFDSAFPGVRNLASVVSEEGVTASKLARYGGTALGANVLQRLVGAGVSEAEKGVEYLAHSAKDTIKKVIQHHKTHQPHAGNAISGTILQDPYGKNLAADKQHHLIHHKVRRTRGLHRRPFHHQKHSRKHSKLHARHPRHHGNVGPSPHEVNQATDLLQRGLTSVYNKRHVNHHFNFIDPDISPNIYQTQHSFLPEGATHPVNNYTSSYKPPDFKQDPTHHIMTGASHTTKFKIPEMNLHLHPKDHPQSVSTRRRQYSHTESNVIDELLDYGEVKFQPGEPTDPHLPSMRHVDRHQIPDSHTTVNRDNDGKPFSVYPISMGHTPAHTDLSTGPGRQTIGRMATGGTNPPKIPYNTSQLTHVME